MLAYREPKLVTHTGDEWLYVLAGEPHWFGPAEGEAVEILHLFGPHGDQAVVRTGGKADVL